MFLCSVKVSAVGHRSRVAPLSLSRMMLYLSLNLLNSPMAGGLTNSQSRKDKNFAPGIHLRTSAKIFGAVMHLNSTQTGGSTILKLVRRGI